MNSIPLRWHVMLGHWLSEFTRMVGVIFRGCEGELKAHWPRLSALRADCSHLRRSQLGDAQQIQRATGQQEVASATDALKAIGDVTDSCAGCV